MSKAKNRRDVDKAVRHLTEYLGPNVEWADRLAMVIDENLSDVADRLGLSDEETYDIFLADELHHMTFGFLFEEYATMSWEDGEPSLIDAYLKHRGWREAPAGRRYLQALAQAKPKLWEVTAVKPGAHVEIREWGTKKKPFRVKEKLASESLYQWDGLAARVLKTTEGRIFSGAMLPFKPDVAQNAHAVMKNVPDRTVNEMQELARQEGIDFTPEMTRALIDELLDAKFVSVAFIFWAVDYYSRAFGAPPEMRNMDDEAIEPVTLHFPILSTQTDVTSVLDSVGTLERTGDEYCWRWLPEPVSQLGADKRVSILGFMRFNGDRLEFETNSRERSERGQALLQEMLGERLGKPLAVHTNLDQFEATALPITSDDLPPELLKAMAAQMTNHYRETLDEPISMLNDKTPRECAKDPGSHEAVISWLKYMENMDQHSPGPAYDFSWMWDELGLERD